MLLKYGVDQAWGRCNERNREEEQNNCSMDEQERDLVDAEILVIQSLEVRAVYWDSPCLPGFSMFTLSLWKSVGIPGVLLAA